MPKQYSRKRAASEEYENDGGFVEDAPKNKKTKAVSTSEAKSKTSTKSGGSENQYWELGCTRRVQLNEFKGNQLVDIREYYEKDDQMLPGKKGISLNIEQFTTFIEQLPEIEQALKAKGISLPRPVYSGTSKKDDEDDKDDEDSDVYEPCHKTAAQAEEHEREVKSSATNKLDKFKHKANHEATSEEDN